MKHFISAIWTLFFFFFNVDKFPETNAQKCSALTKLELSVILFSFINVLLLKLSHRYDREIVVVNFAEEQSDIFKKEIIIESFWGNNEALVAE